MYKVTCDFCDNKPTRWADENSLIRTCNKISCAVKAHKFLSNVVDIPEEVVNIEAYTTSTTQTINGGSIEH